MSGNRSTRTALRRRSRRTVFLRFSPRCRPKAKSIYFLYLRRSDLFGSLQTQRSLNTPRSGASGFSNSGLFLLGASAKSASDDTLPVRHHADGCATCNQKLSIGLRPLTPWMTHELQPPAGVMQTAARHIPRNSRRGLGPLKPQLPQRHPETAALSPAVRLKLSQPLTLQTSPIRKYC